MHFLPFRRFCRSRAYADVERFFADLVAVFREEIAELVARRMPLYPARRDRHRAAVRSRDPERSRARAAIPMALVDRYIDAINGAVAGCPAEWWSACTCAGEISAATISRDGGYESVAERFFAETKANHFLLEYDTPRAGDFAPLRFVPNGKGVVLGLVSSKTPALESMDELATPRRRGRRAISISIGWRSARNAASPARAAGNPLSEADERAKLRRW